MIVVLLSGGLDSTTLIAHYHALDEPLLPLGIHYGQRHARELTAADAVCAHYGLDYQTVDLSILSTLLAGSALTDADVAVPHGHYAAPSMAQTVVPNRNAILLSVAAGYAASQGARAVATAVHAGDHAIYPDCRPEFIAALSHATEIATDTVGPAGLPVQIVAPFVAWTKAEIVRYGAVFAAPYALTWSCYEGGAVHCGQCGTCVERREAFALAGITDPTTYASAEAA